MNPFKPNSIILYVDNVARSTQFYAEILGNEPIEKFQDFTVFALADDFILGLQSKHCIDPKPENQIGGFELCLSDVTIQAVDRIYTDWKTRQIPMALEPVMLDFGYTFVALDPDGHRLRVCATDTTNVV